MDTAETQNGMTIVLSTFFSFANNLKMGIYPNEFLWPEFLNLPPPTPPQSILERDRNTTNNTLVDLSTTATPPKAKKKK